MLFDLVSDGLTTVDMTTAADFTLALGHTPIVQTPNGDRSIPAYVTETIPVVLRVTSEDDLAQTVQELHALQRRCREYWVDGQEVAPVWLRARLDNESNARRALVRRIDFEFGELVHGFYEDWNGGRTAADYYRGTVLVERHPWWEPLSARAFPLSALTNAAAVVYDYTTGHNIRGDVEARVNGLTWRSGLGHTLSKFWMGIRSAVRHGASGVTNFVEVWEIEDASVQNVASVQSDITASPGGIAGEYVRLAPTAGDTLNYVTRIGMYVSDAGYADAQDAYGRFLWLLRALVTSGEHRVRIGIGSNYGYGDIKYGDPVTITSSSWNYYEMGNFTLPTRDPHALDLDVLGAGADAQACIYIENQRISGTGNLYLDCLCPVPTDEGFLKVWDAETSASVDVVFGQGPKDRAQALSYWAGGPLTVILPYTSEHFRLPPGDGRIIAVYQRETQSDINDRITFGATSNATPAYSERWMSLRGAE